MATFSFRKLSNWSFEMFIFSTRLLFTSSKHEGNVIWWMAFCLSDDHSDSEVQSVFDKEENVEVKEMKKYIEN